MFSMFSQSPEDLRSFSNLPTASGGRFSPDGNAGDDGRRVGVDGLRNADVILLGVSRTSKTPTSVYLANRKVKAGNIPLVPGVPLPAFVEELGPRGPLIVGLKISAERLVQIRRQRLISLQEDEHTIYADEAAVRDEVTQANRLFQRNRWKTIDVSRRSVEETAASIIKIHEIYKNNE